MDTSTRVLGAHCLVQADKVGAGFISDIHVCTFLRVCNIFQYFRFFIRSSVRERYLVASVQRETT